jgi:hypothetical protein
VALGLQVVGRLIMLISGAPVVKFAGLFVVILGFSVLITSIRFLALAKGRHPGWSALGLLSAVGLIIALCLRDQSGSDRTT